MGGRAGDIHRYMLGLVSQRGSAKVFGRHCLQTADVMTLVQYRVDIISLEIAIVVSQMSAMNKRDQHYCEMFLL